MHFAEGSAMPPLLMKLIFDRIENGPMPFFVRPVARKISQTVKNAMILPNLQRNLDFMESELGKSDWFAGSVFSAADIQMSFPLEAASVRGGLNEGRPKLWAFLQSIHARPAYQRALEKGGKYELLR
jgi:glutathione S-transferase